MASEKRQARWRTRLNTSFEGIVQRVYNETIRPYLPRKLGCYNGVAVRDLRLFDRDRVVPGFEQAAVEALHRRVSTGDHVGIVGGGRGTTAVHAARQTGPTGEVVVYEAATDRIPLLEETIALNDVDDRVTVTEGIVGSDELVWGDASETIIDPGDLPAFDVIELDCEGAELDVCERFDDRPRDLIIEVHPEYGVDEAAMQGWLDRAGYEVTHRDAIPDQGIISLTATHNVATSSDDSTSGNDDY